LVVWGRCKFKIAGSGQQWKTAKLLREVTTKYYTNSPAGLCGNDDLGQMSAWYVFTAMGFYPVNPMEGKYIFGSPLMESATLQLPNGKTFKILVKNYAAQNIYINRVTLNGKNYPKSYIKHDNLIDGGTLILEMSAKPNKKFAVEVDNRP